MERLLAEGPVRVRLCGAQAHSLQSCALRVSMLQDITQLDTCVLLRLRAVCDGRLPSFGDARVADDVVAACRAARAAYLEQSLPDGGDADGQAKDAATSLEIFRRVWALLQHLPHLHPLHVPPIYTGSLALQQLLLKMVAAVRARDAREERQPVGHFIIGGVEGTGKTTVLKAFAIAVAVCSRRFFLAYVDAAQKNGASLPPTVPQIMTELYVRYNYDLFDGLFDSMRQSGCSLHGADTVRDITRRLYSEFSLSYLLDKLAEDTGVRSGIRVGIIVDEVQVLFVEDQSADAPLVCSVQALHAYARNEVNALLIVSGSSHDLRKSLYKADRTKSLVHYPDFNKSLCGYYHIAALRTTAALEHYLQQRYPSRAASVDVAKLLHLTGGIGRLVHAHVAGSVGSLRDRVLMPAAALANLSTQFYVVVQLIRRHQAHRAGGALQAALEAGTGSALAPEHVSIPRPAIIDALRHEHGISDPDRRLDSWVDAGLLYVDTAPDGSFHVQLARPVDAYSYFSARVAADDVLRLHAVYLMVHRPEVRVNAGFPLEHLMRHRMHTLLAWPSRCGELSIDDSGLLWAATAVGGAATQVCHDNVLTLLHDSAFIWTKEEGLDGIYIAAAESTAGTGRRAAGESSVTITIRGWQCKGGDKNGKLGGGDVQSHRKVGHESDDESLPNILARAERGVLKIIRALFNSMRGSGVAIRFISLDVTTTKTDTRLARSMLAKSCVISIPFDTAREQFGLTAAQMAKCDLKYAVKLHDGTTWLLNALEPELRSYWPPDDVHVT